MSLDNGHEPILLRMIPMVCRDLAGFGQLDHVYGRRATAVFACTKRTCGSSRGGVYRIGARGEDLHPGEQNRLQRSIAGQDWQRDRDPARSSRAVKEYLATLDDTAWGAAAMLSRSSSHRPIPRRNGPELTRDRHSSLMPTTTSSM